MPFAKIQVLEDVCIDNEKQRMIEGVSDAMTAVEGENLREEMFVVLEEVRDRDGAIGGQTLSADDVKQPRADG